MRRAYTQSYIGATGRSLGENRCAVCEGGCVPMCLSHGRFLRWEAVMVVAACSVSKRCAQEGFEYRRSASGLSASRRPGGHCDSVPGSRGVSGRTPPSGTLTGTWRQPGSHSRVGCDCGTVPGCSAGLVGRRTAFPNLGRPKSLSRIEIDRRTANAGASSLELSHKFIRTGQPCATA